MTIYVLKVDGEFFEVLETFCHIFRGFGIRLVIQVFKDVLAEVLVDSLLVYFEKGVLLELKERE